MLESTCIGQEECPASSEHVSLAALPLLSHLPLRSSRPMHRLTAALLLAAGTYVCPIAASPIALQTGATPLAPPAFEKRQTVRCASTTDCKTVGYHGPSNSHFGCNKKCGLCIWGACILSSPASRHSLRSCLTSAECNAGYQLVGGACEQTCDVTAVCTNDVPVNANRYCRRGLCEWRKSESVPLFCGTDRYTSNRMPHGLHTVWRPVSRSCRFCLVQRFIFVHIVSDHNALDHNLRSDASTDRCAVRPHFGLLKQRSFVCEPLLRAWDLQLARVASFPSLSLHVQRLD